MTKNIVFCADGTWNGPADHSDGVAGRTNVYKLFANLAGAPAADPLQYEQERILHNDGGKVVQVTKYLHGVGNSANLLARLLGGGLGAGLIARIVRGYTFISRNYLQGDRITIVGFSRGAYTARALAGLISSRGLLDATEVDLTDQGHAYRLGLASWFSYRKRLNAADGLLGQLRRVLDRLVLPCLDQVDDKLLSHVPIETVAVWDTVGALGIPLYEAGGALDAFQFADLRLSPAVRTGLHAVSIDELRASFTPTLWSADPRVTQVLFAGAHADVGGGYTDDSGLSDIAYSWMARRLAALGLAFAEQPAVPVRPCYCAASHEPWATGIWTRLPHGPRTFPVDLRVKQEVIDRVKLEHKDLDTPRYSPLNAHCFGPGSVLSQGVLIEP